MKILQNNIMFKDGDKIRFKTDHRRTIVTNEKIDKFRNLNNDEWELIPTVSDIIVKLGFDINTPIQEVLNKLKTDKFSWIVINPWHGYYQSVLYYKYKATDTWLEMMRVYWRESLFETEEEALAEELAHLLECNFFKKYL